MNKEFKKWYSTMFFGNTCNETYKQGVEDGAELAWQACAEQKDKEIELLKSQLKSRREFYQLGHAAALRDMAKLLPGKN